MKNTLRLLVVIFILSFTSCNKEEVTNQISDSARIEQIRNELKLAKYLPTDQKFFQLYNEKKSAGLKNGTISPKGKVGFTSPSNDVYLLPNGEFKQVLVWAIIENAWLMEKGIITIHYDENFNQIGDLEIYIGWDNEYCVPVYIKSNYENVQTRLTFSFPVDGGQLSFETFSNGGKNVEMWLPELNFDFLWETCGNSTFGGLKSFNPLNQNEINVQITGIQSNTDDYIKFYTEGILPNSKINIYINDSFGNTVDRTTLIFPFGKSIPDFIMIPLTFPPSDVYYNVTTFENGIAVYGETIQKSCIRLIRIDQTGNIPRIYVLR